MCNLPSMLALMLPRTIKYLTSLTQSQWKCIEEVACLNPQSYCAALVTIKTDLKTISNSTISLIKPKKLIFDIEH